MAEKTTGRTQSQITEAHIENVSGLLRKLKEQAEQAHKDNDVFMLGIYNDLIRVVSPICTKASARLERQDNADINKKHKALKKAAHNAATQPTASA